MQTTVVSPLIWLVAVQLLLYAVGWVACSRLVPEERLPAWHWCAFSALLGLSLALMAMRSEPRGWWAYCGSNALTMLSYIALHRGGELFVRARPRDVEHTLVAVVGIGALLWFGADAANAPWRVLFVYCALALIIARTVTTLHRPVRNEFGRVVSPVLLPAGLLVTGLFGSRAWQQAMNMGVPLELHGSSGGNAPSMIGYLLAAALFNFGFLALLIMRLVNRMRELSQRDALTGLLNRRAFDAELEREWRRYARSREPFALLAVDIDHFKRVNDQHGHAGGDAVLVRVAQLLRATSRQGDAVARVGGEEFVIVMAGAQPGGALDAAQRLRQAVAAAAIEVGGATVSVTASVGLAMSHARDADPASLLRRADEMLYRAKAAGRDRVCTDDGWVDEPQAA